MRLIKVSISPVSNFATTLKGDTLFGQMCWSIVHLYGETRLVSLLDDYKTAPFMVVSDAFAKGYLLKPVMPGDYLGENSADKKSNRKKIWLQLDALLEGNYTEAKSGEELQMKEEPFTQMHNSLNYHTFTTDDKGFAPYGESEMKLGDKDIYVLIDETRISSEELQQIVKFTGHYGYGKDSSIGKGRFELLESEEVKITADSKTFMTLSPSSLKDMDVERLFYQPFVRFGKFGASRAHKNAFKRPLLLADTAAVLHFSQKRKLSFIGRSIDGVSEAYRDAVHQGYAITVPIKELP